MQHFKLIGSNWLTYVLNRRNLRKQTSTSNIRLHFSFFAYVLGEAGLFFIISFYLGSSTLTKAVFAFSILPLLCTHFEQTSSHLNPIHQRARCPPNPPRSFLCFLDVIQTSTGLLKSHFIKTQKVPELGSDILANFTVNLISPCPRGVKRPPCECLTPLSV